MADKTYIYQGPVATGITLPSEKKDKPAVDLLLHQGKPYDLPEDNERVKTLLAKGYLVEQAPVQEPVKAAKAKEASSAS